MNPFFSIVIPTYNRSHLLGPTIESVREQSFDSWELIVVDDGSKDNTIQFIRNTYGSDPRIRLITQPNSERGAARNNGFRHATGEYVCFLDSDDLFLKDHLHTLHEHILLQQRPDFICSKFYLRRNGHDYPADIIRYKQGYYDYRLFLNGNPIACNVCIKRSNPGLKLFEEDRTYSVKEDWLFMLQNLIDQKMFLIDRITLVMEDHDERSMRSDDRMIVDKTQKAYQWIRQHINLPENDDRTLQAHINYLSAVHSYLAGDRGKTISYIYRAIRLRGLQKKYLLMLAKGLVGKKIVSSIYPVKH